MPCLQHLFDNKEKLNALLDEIEIDKQLPIYSSVDIRDAGFKLSVVDTNLFPSGFNNLAPYDLQTSVPILRSSILNLVPNTKRVLLVIENHTRNSWYLENVVVIQTMLIDAGFDVKICSNITHVLEPNCQSICLKSAKGNDVVLFDLAQIISDIKLGIQGFDFVFLNNDLISGIPAEFNELNLPIYPSPKLGWHGRMKSQHFSLANSMIADILGKFHLDPWCFSSLFRSATDIDIHNEEDRKQLADLASDLIADIQCKYDQYGITDKPFVFLKADSGTYGMGVYPIEDPNELLMFNRKNRNKLAAGKHAVPITNYILQEGVPTHNTINNMPSEVCVYQISNHYVGSFFRTNSEKNERGNLNSRGMSFTTIDKNASLKNGAPSQEELDSFNSLLPLYSIIARIAGLAAEQEMVLSESLEIAQI